MDISNIFQEAIEFAAGFDLLGFLGLIFGLLCVWFLIKQNILTWPAGILYVLISLVVFIQAKLYADFVLHVIYLVLNIYGWYYWVSSRDDAETAVPVTRTGTMQLSFLLLISAIGVIVSGKLLSEFTDASLPYWDSTTSVLSITAMWLTAKKKLENWVIWLFVDVLATGIYYYKGLYFYCLLYLVYTGMAIAGYLSWRKSMYSAATT